MIRTEEQGERFLVAAVLLFLLVRFVAVVHGSALQSTPFDTNDHYAYLCKNVIAEYDPGMTDPKLKRLRDFLYAASQTEKGAAAKREYHQLFCQYHPLYTRTIQALSMTLGLSFKQAYFALQLFYQSAVAFILLFLLRALKLSPPAIGGFFLLAAFNWGMTNSFFFYSMPKNFMPLFSFLLALLCLRLTDRPLRLFLAGIPLFAVAAAWHVMAYAFLAIPLLGFTALALLQRSRKRLAGPLALLLLLGVAGIAHKLLIQGGVLPGYLSNYTPYADLSLSFGLERLWTNLGLFAMRLPYFSDNIGYWILFGIGFFAALAGAWKRREFGALAFLGAYNLVPLASLFALSPVFAYRTFPMALYLDLAFACGGWLAILMHCFHLQPEDAEQTEAAGPTPDRKRLWAAYAVLLVALNALALPSFVRNYRMAVFSQLYDMREEGARRLFACLPSESLVGIQAQEILFLSAMYNGIFGHDLLYTRYLDPADPQARESFGRITHFLGAAPWASALLVDENRMGLRAGDRLTLRYRLPPGRSLREIAIAGEGLDAVEKMTLRANGAEISFHRLDGADGLRLVDFGPAEQEVELAFSVNSSLFQRLQVLYPCVRISSIRLRREGEPDMPVAASLDWALLESLILERAGTRTEFPWRAQTDWGDEPLPFEVIYDDGYMYCGKIIQ